MLEYWNIGTFLKLSSRAKSKDLFCQIMVQIPPLAVLGRNDTRVVG